MFAFGVISIAVVDLLYCSGTEIPLGLVICIATAVCDCLGVVMEEM